MATPSGYADVSLFIRNTTTTRPSCLTFGVAAESLTATQVATAVQTAFNFAGGIKTRLPTECVFDRVRVSLGDPSGQDIVEDKVISIACSSIQAMLPPNCAVLVSKRSSQPGRRGRGRWFIPWCVPEGKVASNGLIDATELTAIQTALDITFTQLGAANVPMRILHQPGQTAPGVPATVLGLAVDSMISTQRRRLGR